MRAALPFHFRLTEDELRAIWSNGQICFDASSLLNMYGYSEETSAALVALIKENGSRVWSPYQFALEYARNRPGVIAKQIANFQRTEASLQKFESDFLKPRREHPHLSADASAAFKTVKDEIREKRKLMERRMSLDNYVDILSEVFHERVGPAPDQSALDALHTEAAARYANLQPPGFMDLKDKEVPGAYGDYIAWRQLMDHAKVEQKDIILVTDDDKEDWWWKEGSRNVAPLASLLGEFHRETGRRCWFYSTDGFLRAAKVFTQATIDDEVIAEVSESLRSERQAEVIEKDEPDQRSDAKERQPSRAGRILSEIEKEKDSNEIASKGA